MKPFLKYKDFCYSVLLILGILFVFQQKANAQEKPPRPIAVYVSTLQNLNFGAIIEGTSGGTVTVYPDGTRTSTGDVYLADMGIPHTPALFEVKANIGTLITIINGPDATLSGSNGGSVTMSIGASDPPSPFVQTNPYPTLMNVRVGGTLTIGSTVANPPGTYNGTFMLTFIQQ